ncbi:hypothetical protein DSO57_1005531 [Entomophthora muscae]|uniref:Uncharacterized protein n=1 Tax=Entomophthora muscae TaxID=34485 RepID=A0ACC2SX68_9FUNG|nr:hypothetical protein DSO57_1005531 [Entomophthora muscae]
MLQCATVVHNDAVLLCDRNIQCFLPCLCPLADIFYISYEPAFIAHNVRIDNSSSLETRAWEQESNPNPGFLWAARPVDCGTTQLRFSGIEPPQADTENVDSCSKKSQIKEIITPNGRLITAPNRVYTSNQSRANPGKRHRPAAWSHDLNTKAR